VHHVVVAVQQRLLLGEGWKRLQGGREDVAT
jgi:hypothetical protein